MKRFILFSALFFLSFLYSSAQENIDNEGAICIKEASTLTPPSGTIEYRSGEFRGYDGSSWNKLDNPAYTPPPASHVYAWLSDSIGIPVNIWTKIPFNIVEFDIAGEFIPSTPGSPYSHGSFFPALPGFYQVTARCEYEVPDYQQATLPDGQPIHIEPRSYVSIAVFTGVPSTDPSPMDDHMYSQGNNLQIAWGLDFPFEYGQALNRNNAPNISTIVEVFPGESISIYGFWYQPSAMAATGNMPFQIAHDPGGGGYHEEAPTPETGGPPPAVPHKSKVYVTIHKVYP